MPTHHNINANTNNIYVGAHINREKTILKTMETITKNGGNCLQLFVSNPRSLSLVNIDNYINIANDIKDYLLKNNFKTIIHSSYTINLARDFKNGKRAIPINECPWIQLFLHELYISHIIGSIGVVVHVGKHTTQSKEYGLENMRISIEYIIEELHKNNLNTKIIIETPAGQGTELLTDLNDFMDFYNSFSSSQKKYLGICLDTAHIWATGYELIDAYKIICNKNLNDLIAIHLNNSNVAQGSNVDRHATLFDNSGTIPYNSIKQFIELFKNNDNKKQHIPIIILETPSIQYKDELNWCNNLLQ
jgi:deoxyribonuclease-4